jgi:hypothetical protein
METASNRTHGSGGSEVFELVIANGFIIDGIRSYHDFGLIWASTTDA